MNYIYKYEDSMRQCETLFTENTLKLCNYSMCLLSSTISSSESTERVEEYEIMKKRLDTAQENIDTLKSEYNDLTVHCMKSTSSGIEFKGKFFNYLGRQEPLRLKFIETINECKHINSRLDDILLDCSNEALNKSSIKKASKRVRSNTADAVDLSSIPKVYVVLPKLDWDHGDPLTSDGHNLESGSFSKKHAEELCTSAAVSASKLLEVSSSDLNSDVALKKCNSTTILETKKLKNWSSCKRNEEPFECAHCGKLSTQKEHLKSHIFSMHMPYQCRPYKCDICSKFYSTRNHLNYHRCSASARRNTASDRRQSHVCTIFHKNFRYQSDLETHRLVHEGRKPFKCDECDKSFAIKEYMRRHIVLMHINDQRSLGSYYYCAHCSHRSQSKECLLYHIKRNHMSNLSLGEFSCTVCGKTFTKRYYRTLHEQTVHVQLKRFCCNNCGKQYKFNNCLARHLRLEQCKPK